MTRSARSALVVVVLLATPLFGLVFAPSGETSANKAIPWNVYNNSHSGAIIGVDNSVKCSLLAGQTCTFDLTTGEHVINFTRSSDDGTAMAPKTIPETWNAFCIYIDDKGITFDDCGR